MGIHGFYFNWLRNRNFQGVLKRYLPWNVSSLLIDMNGIIHRTSHIVYATDAIEEEQNERQGIKRRSYGRETREEKEKKIQMKIRMNKLRRKADRAQSEGPAAFLNFLLKLEEEHFRAITLELVNLLTSINPIDLLIISIDGPAPVAKMKQQRSRRFRSGKRRETTTLSNQGGYSWPLFDSNSITPGTDFMFRLDTYLRKWLKDYTIELPSKVIYYSHMVPGEGEHRIMDDIRAGIVEESRSSDGAHVIYGSDSDLAMLALIAPLDNLYIARDSLTDVININEFREAVRDSMKTTTSLNDFVVLFFLVGNDFLPRQPSMKGEMTKTIDGLILIYQLMNGVAKKEGGRYVYIESDELLQVQYPLTNSDEHHTINWAGMITLIYNLGQNEGSFLDNIINQRQPKFPSSMMVGATKEITPPPLHGIKQEVIKSIDYNSFRNLWYINALVPKTHFHIMSDLDRKLLGTPKITEEEMGKMVLSYLQGIGWVNTYYNQGTHSIDIDWFYSREYAPLFKDIFGSMKKDTIIPPYIRRPQQNYYNSIWQLLSIFPRASQDLLPIEVRYLMGINSPISDLYPTNFVVEKNGINAEWQGIALLPPFNPGRVVKTVQNDVKFSVIRQQQFREGAKLTLVGTGGSRFVTRRKIGANQQVRNQRRGEFRDRDRGEFRGRGRGGFGGRGREEFRGRGRGGFRGRGRGEFRGRGGFRGRDRGGFGGRGRGGFGGRGRGGFGGQRRGGRRQEFRRDDVSLRRDNVSLRRDDVGLRRQLSVKTPISRVVEPAGPISNLAPSGTVSLPQGITPTGRLERLGKSITRRSFASVFAEQSPSTTPVQARSRRTVPVQSRSRRTVPVQRLSSIPQPRIGTRSPFTLTPQPATSRTMTASNLSVLRQPDRTRTERRLTAYHSQTPKPATQRSSGTRFSAAPRRQYKPSRGQKQQIRDWNDQEKLM